MNASSTTGGVDVHGARFRPGDPTGHYESYFLRANHPSEPRAFWIRYTVFSPRGRPGEAIGELWAVYFDGTTGQHTVAKSEHPIEETAFGRDDLDVRIADATLIPGRLEGGAASGGHAISWALDYASESTPLLLFPPALYDTGFPKAKALVGAPNADFSGALEVDGRPVAIDGWVGSQNHNWGSKHTDKYAWGQVAGFDGHPESFLEIATARVKVGPIWIPPMTLMVLCHDGAEIAMNTMGRALRASGRYGYFDWRFASRNNEYRIEGEITAQREDFVGLTYYNPPGGVKTCLNSKLARCSLTLTQTTTGHVEQLHSTNRTAFEILTSESDHGIELRV